MIAIENVRLFDEVQAKTRDLSEALTYQTGSANILSVIASSPTNVAPVLQAIVTSACELCDAYDAVVILTSGDGLIAAAHHGPIPLNRVRWANDRTTISGRAIIDQRSVHVRDLASDEGGEFPTAREMRAEDGGRTALGVPMFREGESIGAIVLRRAEVQPFNEKQISLLQTFADQAVIAVENTRLFNETREALERQTATADILKVIASSPDDVQPVFEAIVQTGLSLFPSSAVMLVLADDGIVRPAAIAENDPKLAELLKSAFPVPLTRDFMHTVAILDGRLVDIPDAESGPAEFPAGRSAFLSTGHRAITIMPMMRGDQSIGALSVVRRLPGSLSDRELELLKTFADQAVIAIENTRLLKELRERTDDLSESLQQQTATADVLKVISRSAFELQPVLDTLISSAVTLCGAVNGTMCLRERDGYRFRASFGIEGDWAKFLDEHPPTPSRSSLTGRVLLSGRVESVPDVLEDPDYIMPLAAMNKTRSVLGVPLLRHEKVEGVLLLARAEPGLFTQRQIELVQTFADQAVIAIENVRLFDEVQARTNDLTEALTHQTGSANILNVIASSPTDVQPVMNAIVESACELCGAYDAVALLKEGDDLLFSAHHGPIPMRSQRRAINRRWTAGRAFIDKKAVHVHDLQAERDEFPEGMEMARDMGHRSIVSVPLLREGESIGALVLRRIEVNPFSEKQIALLQTFADQAVIAIENVRLFDEVQAKTRDLTETLDQQIATSDVLKAISQSAFDLQPVFDAIAENSVKLCHAERAFIFRFDGRLLRAVASYNVGSEIKQFVEKILSLWEGLASLRGPASNGKQCMLRIS